MPATTIDTLRPPVATRCRRQARAIAAEPALNDDHLLSRLIEASLTCVPAADIAGVSMCDRSGLATVARSHHVVDALDVVQSVTRRGPTINTFRGQPAPNGPLAGPTDDNRWPEFAAYAARYDLGSFVAYRMPLEAGRCAVLTLYAYAANVLTIERCALAGLLADQTGAALTATQSAARLQEALASRDLIGQAKGVLMERLGVDAQQAFDLLAGAAHATHRKVRDVAAQLAEGGALPPLRAAASLGPDAPVDPARVPAIAGASGLR